MAHVYWYLFPVMWLGWIVYWWAVLILLRLCQAARMYGRPLTQWERKKEDVLKTFGQ